MVSITAGRPTRGTTCFDEATPCKAMYSYRLQRALSPQAVGFFAFLKITYADTFLDSTCAIRFSL